MQQDIDSDNGAAHSPPIEVHDLLNRCRALLRELEQFQEFIVKNKKEKEIEVRHFRTSVTAELKSLERLSAADPDAERTIHTLRSSNLPFHVAVWSAARSCTSLVTFNKRFYWDGPPPRDSKGLEKPKRRSALVDIVANGGQEWVKVSTVTETRLLFEKAKAGWEEGEDSASEQSRSTSEDESSILEEGQHEAINHDERKDDQEDNIIELLKIASDLQKASRANRFRYRYPRVRFVLPKIKRGHSPIIDEIIASISATNAIVQCANEVNPISRDTNGSTSHAYLQPNEHNTNNQNEDNKTEPQNQTPFPNFAQLLPDPFAAFTQTINLDCTILLALVSDLSHRLHPLASSSPHSPAKEREYHRAIYRQIELESHEQLLPNLLYPAMEGKTLVCTDLAAKRMKEIVALIGTDEERKRTQLVLGSGSGSGELLGEEKTGDALRRGMRELSEHANPKEWELPIRVVVTGSLVEDDEMGFPWAEELLPVARKIAAELSDINRSVFLYGWAEGLTTLSSNRGVVKLIEGIIDHEVGEVIGPDVWLCPVARSLAGKEKGRGD